jgi:hypothetical protein
MKQAKEKTQMKIPSRSPAPTPKKTVLILLDARYGFVVCRVRSGYIKCGLELTN